MKKQVKAWAVLNLGGKNMTWGYLEQYKRLPVFLRKKAAVQEKECLDEQKPARIEGMEREVVPCTITYDLSSKDKN